MATITCEHIIGMIYDYDNTSLATLNELKEHIKHEETQYIHFWRGHKPYTLIDYADKRKNTDLTRFNYCPNCGKEIDWKAIKRLDNEQRAD